MIDRLKKYPKTFEKFEKYMSKFYLKDQGLTASFGDSIELRCEHCDRETLHDIPDQFLIGCLMDFLERNDLDISLYPENEAELVCDGFLICEGWNEVVFEKGFAFLESMQK